MELFLPCLRADFSLNETYQFRPAESLPCPITAFGGREDPEATLNMLQEWSQHTASQFQIHEYTGGHFFVNQNREAIIDTIVKSLD